MSRRRRGRAQKNTQARKRPAVAQPSRPVTPTIWLLGGLLVAAVVFAYQHAWSAGYIWDDDMYVTNNPLLTAADGLRGRGWAARAARVIIVIVPNNRTN
jgi:hypothetical protein